MTGLIRMHSTADVDDLAWSLQDHERWWPAVVCTEDPRWGFYTDLDHLAEELGATARTFFVPVALQDAFTRACLNGGDVFGAAVRVYPPGDAWVSAPNRAQYRSTGDPRVRQMNQTDRVGEVVNLVGTVRRTRTAPAESGTSVVAETPEEAQVADGLALELSLAHEKVDRLRAEVRRLNDQHGAVPPAVPAEEETDLTKPDDAFRREVFDAWLRRIPEPDRAAKPLAGYRIGDGFLSSLDSNKGVSRQKVLDVVVEVLTGLAVDIPARSVRKLRAGHAGTDHYVSDPVLGDCFRVNLQTNTPAARRLHVWRDSSAVWTLDSVRIHDDVG